MVFIVAIWAAAQNMFSLTGAPRKKNWQEIKFFSPFDVVILIMSRQFTK